MKILTLLLFAIYINSSLAKHPDLLTKIIDDCISHGDHHSLKSEDCSKLPQQLQSRYEGNLQTLCKNSFKIACFNAKIYSHCENGVKYAKQNADCDSNSSDVSFKKCCTACKHGQVLKSISGHCSNSLKRFDSYTASIIEECCNSFADFSQNDDIQLEIEASLCPQLSLCAENEICVDLPNNDFECQCKKGFRKNDKSNSCVDINECEENANICGELKICINKIGTYECGKCPNGFRPGKLTSAEDFECIDIDECEENPCGTDKICQNFLGGYKCVAIDVLRTNCTEGFELVEDKCFDINECEIGICETNEHCTNLRGSYRCEKIECEEGFINHPKTNCLRKSCSKLATYCQKLPIRFSHFFTVVDRFSKDENIKIFDIKYQNFETYKNFNLIGFNAEYFGLKIVREIGAVVVMKKTPMEDQTFKIQMNVYRNGKTFVGHQVYVFHVYVQ